MILLFTYKWINTKICDIYVNSDVKANRINTMTTILISVTDVNNILYIVINRNVWHIWIEKRTIQWYKIFEIRHILTKKAWKHQRYQNQYGALYLLSASGPLHTFINLSLKIKQWRWKKKKNVLSLSIIYSRKMSYLLL